MILFLDFETRSELGFKKHKRRDGSVSTGVGQTLYAKHPSTEILCACIAEDNGDVQTLKLGESEKMKAVILRADTIVAHNAVFEARIIEHVLRLRIPAQRFICTAALSRAVGLPGSLRDAALALGIDQQKEYNSLKLSKPRPQWVNKGTGEKWFWSDREYDELCYYCAQDVRVCRDLFHALPPLLPQERKIWLMDFAINKRGVPLDIELIRACMTRAAVLEHNASTRIAALTDGRVRSAKQRDKLLAELRQRGVYLDNMRAQTIDQCGVKDELLEQRRIAGGAAHAKYKALWDKCDGTRLPDGFLYAGAHTLRWSSKGVQVHNLIKPPLDPNVSIPLIPLIKSNAAIQHSEKDALDSMVRHCIRAKDGHVLVACDLANIEARLVNWLARQDDILDAFAQGVDLYKKQAALIYGCRPEDIKKPSKERDVGKQCELGSGFGMRPNKFLSTCHGKGLVDVTMDQAEKAILAYESTHPRVKALWYRMHRAAVETVLTRQSHAVKDVRGPLRFLIHRFGQHDALGMLIPSGRCVWYPQIKMESGELLYWGKKNNKPAWCKLYHCVEIENAVQSLARDRFSDAMLLIDQLAHGAIVMHGHDEIVCEVEEDHATDYAAQMEALLKAPTVWSRELPVDVETWIGKEYRK